MPEFRWAGSAEIFVKDSCLNSAEVSVYMGQNSKFSPCKQKGRKATIKTNKKAKIERYFPCFNKGFKRPKVSNF